MGKVDVPGDDLQWIAQAFDLALAGITSKQVKLHGASRLGHGNSTGAIDGGFEGRGF